MFLRLLIIFIIALIAGAYFFSPKNPDDDRSALSQGLSKIRSLSKDLDNTTHKTSTVYKWQDAEGEWHFSNTPPPAGIRREVQTYRTDSNLIQAPQHAKTAAPTANQSTPESGTLPGLTSLGKANEIMNDARAIQGLNDNRIQMLNEQIDAKN